MYRPIPSNVGPRWTVTPEGPGEAKRKVLFGGAKMASDRSRPTLAAWMSKALTISMSSIR